MSIILLIVFFGISYWIAKVSTDCYIDELNKENIFFKPLNILGKTAITLISLIILLSLKDIIFDCETKINILTFSAIGIIVSVLLTITYNFYMREEDKIKEKLDNDKEINNLLRSIRDEINLVWKHFKDDVEEHITDEKVARVGFQLTMEVTMDYFVIYNSNTDKIGKIENKELREKIIFIQIKAKSLIDSLLLNNKMLNDSLKYKNDKSLSHGFNIAIMTYGAALQNKYHEIDKNVEEINVLFNNVLEN
jgi:hypothetical protein